MPYPAAVRSYVVGALSNAPLLMKHLLGEFSSSDPIWDLRPHRDRFSLREMIAHVADWNDIYIERLECSRDEDRPLLPDKDEGKIAEERDYGHSDPVRNLERFASTRHKLIRVVESLPFEAWDRIATREGVGELSIGDQIALISAHDAYHVRQALDYLESARKGVEAATI